MFIPRVETIQGTHGECRTTYHNPAYPVIPRIQPVDLRVVWTRVVLGSPTRLMDGCAVIKGPTWD